MAQCPLRAQTRGSRDIFGMANFPVKKLLRQMFSVDEKLKNSLEKISL